MSARRPINGKGEYREQVQSVYYGLVFDIGCIMEYDTPIIRRGQYG